MISEPLKLRLRDVAEDARSGVPGFHADNASLACGNEANVTVECLNVAVCGQLQIRKPAKLAFVFCSSKRSDPHIQQFVLNMAHQQSGLAGKLHACRPTFRPDRTITLVECSKELAFESQRRSPHDQGNCHAR